MGMQASTCRAPESEGTLRREQHENFPRLPNEKVEKLFVPDPSISFTSVGIFAREVFA